MAYATAGDPVVHDGNGAEHTVVLSPPAGVPAAMPHVFISHAGEQKHGLVSHLQARFKKEHPELEVFVDEWSLKPGDRPLERISAQCWGTAVGVLLLTKEFVRKWYCMAELRVLLHRWRAGQVAQAAADTTKQNDQDFAPGKEQQVQLLPVLYGLTVEQLKGMRALYDSEPWCVAGEKRSKEVLDQWAADLQEVAEFTMMRWEQRRGDAELVDKVVQRVMEQLEAVGKLPRGKANNLVVHSFVTPPPSVALVGRQQELEQGLRALREQRYVEIRGPPGEGKSMLAQHLVESLHEEWSHLPQEAAGQAAYLLEVDVEVPVDTSNLDASRNQIKCALAAKLLAAVREERNNGHEWEALLDWLRRQTHVAILLENAEKALLSQGCSGDLESALNCLHALRNVHLLLATRVQGPVIKGTTPDTVVQLGQLTEADSLRLVEAHLGEGWAWGAGAQDREAARQLVQLVEGNPLVLSMAAGLVCTNKLASWQEVFERAKETGLASVRPRARIAQGGLTTYMSLLSHWLSTFLDEEAQHLLAALAVFPGSFTAAGAEAVAGCSGPLEGLHDLVYASLVRKRIVHHVSSRHPEQQEERYSMHAVVRDTVARSPDAGQCSLSLSFVHWMVLHEAGPGQVLLRCAPEGAAPDMRQRLHLLQEELLNLGAVGAHLEAATQQEPHAVGDVVSKLGPIAYVFSRSGHGLAAKRCLESLVSVAVVVLGPEHLSTLASKGYLASTLWGMGEVRRARRLEEEVLEIRTRVLGPEHPHTLTSNNNLAIILWGMGELEGARQLQELAWMVRTRVLGPQHSDSVASKHNLASMLRGMGELGTARQLQEEVLEVRAQVLGPDHPDVLTGKGNMAHTLWDMGDREGARQLQEQVLGTKLRVLGPEHPDTLASKSNLANMLRAMGELAEARRLQEEVVQVRARVLGSDHPDTVVSKGSLATALWYMGDLAGATQLHREVLEVRTRVLGPEHPDALASKANLAATLVRLGQLQEATQLQGEVLHLRTQVLGPDHPRTVKARNNFACLRAALARRDVSRG